MNAKGKHPVTSARMNWARSEAERRQRQPGSASLGDDLDFWILYYLFFVSDGPDYGIVGAVDAPAGDLADVQSAVAQDPDMGFDAGPGGQETNYELTPEPQSTVTESPAAPDPSPSYDSGTDSYDSGGGSSYDSGGGSSDSGGGSGD
jgi:uncharacterized membrane protein YgcG